MLLIDGQHVAGDDAHFPLAFFALLRRHLDGQGVDEAFASAASGFHEDHLIVIDVVIDSAAAIPADGKLCAGKIDQAADGEVMR